MKPFISTNKIYRINVSISAENFIEDCLKSTIEPHTVVFFDSDSSGEGGRELLDKILQSVKLDVQKIVVVDHATYPTLRIRNLRKVFPTLINILVFELPLKSIGLNANLPSYSVESIPPYMVLTADSLAILSESETMKRLLWNSLKTLYPQ